MQDKNKFFIIFGIVGLILLGSLFWYSTPQSRQSVDDTQSVESLKNQLNERSFYTDLPINYSPSQVGKDNPFQ